jgi:Zn-dependent protease
MTSDSPPTARVFYAVDSRRLSLREYWWGEKHTILIAALLKLFRVRIPSATDDPCVESLAPFEVDASEVPGVILQRFSLLLHQLGGQGFRSPVWYVIEDDVNRVKTYLATLQHESGRIWARAHHRIWHIRSPAKTTMFCELVSELAGNQFVWTLSSKADLAAPSSCTVVRDVGGSPSRLMAKHQSALKALSASRVLQVDTTDELRASVERHHASVRAYHVARGVFAPLTHDEKQTAVDRRSSITAAETSGSRYPEILAEVDRLQRKTASRSNGVMLLLISIGLFFGAGLTNTGGKGFSADFLLILVAVLFVHEMGHWVAMRIFGYRNMKMFFIPFFGAAVSGRHYNVPGWKKAIVSLMGPLPGLILGAGIGWLGVTMHQPLLVKISLIALALNGFNLLPILPLDGGWIVQAILFSRHHWLELAFRVVALAALAVGAIATSDNVLIAVAVVMGISLPAMYKLARITNELRKAHVPPGSDDGQTLPQATADVIVGKIKSVFSAKLGNKAAAQYTLQIFENLNARAPGVLASIGFFVLQFGAIAATIVASLLIYAASAAGTWHKTDASSLVTVRTPGDSALATPRNVVVAGYDMPEKLVTALSELKRNASTDLAVQRFGQTLIIALPLEDVSGLRELQTKLETSGATLFVSTPDQPASMRLKCDAATAIAGKAIEQELGGYLRGSGLNLAPPWQPGYVWSPDERTRYRKARNTYFSVRRAMENLRDDPAMSALVERFESAYTKHDTGKLAQVEIERVALTAKLRHERLLVLRKDVAVDTAVIDGYALIESEGDTSTARDRRRELIGPLLGQLPLIDGQLVPGALEWSVTGSVHSDGAKVSLPSLSFTNAFQGPPALASWLLGKACRDMRYSFAPGISRSARGGAANARDKPSA